MLALTIDVDWAPDPVVDAVMNLFELKQVPVTLFCTDPDTDHSHNSSPLAGRYHRRHELALHPNFGSFADGDVVIRRLLNHYPSARGFRSHNGCTGWSIVSAAAACGLLYQVECLVYPVDVPPFKLRDPSNFSIFTNRFMDSHMLHQPQFRWTLAETGLASGIRARDQLTVMSFHPNIVYYDMLTVADYLDHRPHYHQPREQDSFLSKPAQGPAKLVQELTDSIDRECFTTIGEFGSSKNLW